MYEKELSICKDIVLAASEEILKVYSTDFNVEKKDDASPVTKADIEANKVIVSILKKEFDYLIVSEESLNHQQYCDEEYCFIVDPIDGTKEFIKKNGEFTINIALLHKDELVLGVVYAPVLKELYYAVKGQGAYLEKDGITKKIQVSNRKNQLKILISRSHQRLKSIELLEENSNRILKISRLGSSLKGCRIACGDQDAYYRFGPTCIWDTAAMQVIVEEAGGVLKLLNGEKIDYRKKDYINDEFYIINDESNLFKGYLKA
jgi:3'(2'), 5'-bisphosphate nucleotidase